MYPIWNAKPHNPLNPFSVAKKHTTFMKAVKLIKNKSEQQNRDIVSIRSTSTQSREQPTETGIYEPYRNQMRVMLREPYTQLGPDPSLQKEILPESEKTSYTEHDALMNQYLKQYRIDGHFEGNKIILDSDKPVRLVLASDVSDAELEKFRQGLVPKGLGPDIDWKEVNSDLGDMNVDFDNVERLNVKTDYLSSRYAVLENRIQKQYTGDEQAAQMNKLNKIYTVKV